MLGRGSRSSNLFGSDSLVSVTKDSTPERDTTLAPARISVIIPTLQEEKLIVETLTQFTPALRLEHHLEIIVSDGGSSDRTIELARGLADRVVLHQEPFPQTIAMGRNEQTSASTRHAIPRVFFSIVRTAIQPRAKYRVDHPRAQAKPGA